MLCVSRDFHSVNMSRSKALCVMKYTLDTAKIDGAPQVPDRLSLALSLMESAVEAVEGRLKSPTKKQGIICRTLLKALLMECFAWLPPLSFPGSSARLFKVGPR